MIFLIFFQSADSDPSAQPPIDKSGYVWYNEYILLRKAVLSVKKSSASIIRLLCILLPLVLLLSGCIRTAPKATRIATYPKDNAPLQIIPAGDRWVALVGAYESDDYSVSVSESPETLNPVYSVKDTSIWFFTANEHCIAWCEESEIAYTYKAYLFDEEKVITLVSINDVDNYQPQNVGVYGKSIYYTNIDYSAKNVTVYAYDITSQTAGVVLSEPYAEEGAPYVISVEDVYLSYAGYQAIKVIRLDNGETVFESALPNAVEYVYAISYDSANDACGLYYCDEDSEDIGIFKEGDTEVLSHFTFNENHYAYHDQIRCTNGHLYWIVQSNVTGLITDHYILMEYNYIDPEPKEIERTFYCYIDGDTVYTLRFNKKGNYDGIESYRH